MNLPPFRPTDVERELLQPFGALSIMLILAVYCTIDLLPLKILHVVVP